MYEIYCGGKDTMEYVAKRGVTALNPKTDRFQLVDKNAKYEVREDETFLGSNGELQICATLLSDMDLRAIADKKGLIM